MASIANIGTITKVIEANGGIIWVFPTAQFELAPNSEVAKMYYPASPDTPSATLAFEQITSPPIGVANIEQYIDWLATSGKFAISTTSDGAITDILTELEEIGATLLAQATAARQDIGNASLSSIDTKLSSQATALKQDDGNSYLQAIRDTQKATTNAVGKTVADSTYTILDLKQTHDNLPLFFDRVNNGTASQTWQSASSSTQLAVSANNDYAIAQTFQRPNYQTGKPQEFTITFANFSPVANTTKRVGAFNGGAVAPYATFDGIFLKSSGTEVTVCIANNGTVSEYSNTSPYWLDKLDGTGASGQTVDWALAQVLVIEYLWLGYGPVSLFLLLEGQKVLFFEKNHENLLTAPYMLSPNQPVRYEIRSTGGAATLLQTCASVASLGGRERLGAIRGIDTGNTALSFASSGTQYLMLAMRLKSTHLDSFIELLAQQVLCTSNDDFLYRIVLNPTIAGVVTYQSLTNSAIEYAVGIATNTVTGGTVLQVGIGRQANVARDVLENVIRLGSTIAGTADVFALTFTPLSAGANAYGTVNILESN